MTTNEPPTQQQLNPRLNDPRSTEALIAAALADEEDADSVLTLQYRGTQDVFDAAAALCSSEVAQERGIGVWILGQLGVQPPTFVTESVDVLLPMLQTEQDNEILENIVVALGHRRDPRAIEPLIALHSHPTAHVRYGVVLGLNSFYDPRAIDTLITLSSDTDPLVRDWATFGLGSIQDVDTPEVRDALLARVGDDDEEARGEAMVGLARRRDPRVIEPLQRELALPSVSEFAIRAATEFPDPSLVPHLLAVMESQSAADSSDEDIAEAISRCRGAIHSSDPEN